LGSTPQPAHHSFPLFFPHHQPNQPSGPVGPPNPPPRGLAPSRSPPPATGPSHPAAQLQATRPRQRPNRRHPPSNRAAQPAPHLHSTARAAAKAHLAQDQHPWNPRCAPWLPDAVAAPLQRRTRALDARAAAR
jgi:hypothetical protein